MEQPKKVETTANVVAPPDDIFASKHVVDETMFQDGAVFYAYERTEYPPEGGIYVYYEGMPYPQKGFPFPDAVWMNDVVKRITVFFLRSMGSKDMILPALAFAILPWKWQLRTFEKFLYNFARVALWMFQSIFLKDDRYCNAGRSLRKLVERFLIEVGIVERTAQDFAKVVATMIEYDNAYRYRFEDIMTETTRAQLISRPIREFRRLGAIFRKREKYVDMFSKLDSFIALGTVALMIPRVRRAFRTAVGSLNGTEFDMMKLDDADKYHVLNRPDYDYMGKSHENRMRRLAMIHTTSKCHDAPVFGGSERGKIYCTKCDKECTEWNFNPPRVIEVKK